MNQISKIISQDDQYDISALKILIVDDNKNMRKLVRHLLRAFGIRNVQEAEDGKSALKCISIFKPDLTISDWNMAPMDGLAFTRAVRANSDPALALHPIILLTAYTEVSHVMEARDAGIDEYLAKPVSAESLYKKMISIIKNRREFVKTQTFFGPDRRRRNAYFEFDFEDRRKCNVFAEDCSHIEHDNDDEETVYIDMGCMDQEKQNDRKHQVG